MMLTRLLREAGHLYEELKDLVDASKGVYALNSIDSLQQYMRILESDLQRAHVVASALNYRVDLHVCVREKSPESY